MITIKRGLNLPVSGEPKQEIDLASEPRTVALISDDYVGMKPTMAVVEGDVVKLGQLLFTDKKTEGVRYTSPAAGKVVAVHRGAKRKFESIVIELDGDEEETFTSYAETELAEVSREKVVENLVESGLWPALRTRPYSKVPAIDSEPHSIFVTAIDTNPLAPDVEVVLAEREADFVTGLHVLNKLTAGKLYLCTAPEANIPGKDMDFVTVEEFGGPHPAGLPGTHIHYLDPVGNQKTVWTIGYQDVAAFGYLFNTGKLSVERVVALAGPMVENPRLLKTRLGVSLDDLIQGELKETEHDLRVISGSILSGRAKSPLLGYLGRYHQQVSVLEEGNQRIMFGWMGPGFNKFSITNLFVSSLKRGQKFAMNTSTEGSRRAMVPIGTYEKVMPLDIIPTYLLRALIVGDTEQAQALGALELDEDDLALCTFVCPGKYEYGPLLRTNLTRIEQEG
ncbi:Na(+)-translocating NADH-quinone reductase subunit A [Planctomycetales bacterium 10988]|nr:Na(+)-translocating NADH-quinone reductase subunit A [Planctomycetales bacterium 10988]